MARPPLPTGGAYGSRQRLERFQQSGPMLPDKATVGGGVSSPAPPPAANRVDVFGPTDRPDEPITAGIPLGPGPSSPGLLPRDDNMRLRAAYRVAVDRGWPEADDLAEMIRQGS